MTSSREPAFPSSCELAGPGGRYGLRSFAKQAALGIQGVRHLYMSSLELSKRAQVLSLQNRKLIRSHGELKLQLYILRSDLARAVDEAEELCAALRNMERIMDDLSRDKDMYLDEIRRMERGASRSGHGDRHLMSLRARGGGADAPGLSLNQDSLSWRENEELVWKGRRRTMGRSKFPEEQIIGILREHEAGLSTREVCRRYGISDATFLQVARQVRRAAWTYPMRAS